MEKQFDLVGFIMGYENDELSNDEITKGFQHLIDNGMAWTLQGTYGRMATHLIEAGYCTQKESV